VAKPWLPGDLERFIGVDFTDIKFILVNFSWDPSHRRPLQPNFVGARNRNRPASKIVDQRPAFDLLSDTGDSCMLECNSRESNARPS